jgi:ADP-ribose pyrophosphatase
MPAPTDRVRVIDTRIGYEGFFRIDLHRLRFRRFDGAWSDVVEREVFERGSAAAVLPYDPRLDRLVLIRQFLAGFHFSGRDAFPLHILAGMINPSETLEQAARRETREEAGLSLSARCLGTIASYLPSPGGSSEVITVFAACVDASRAGGQHGLAEEHEDIRVEVVAADDAIRLLDRGEIADGPTLVSLLWLARHRDRLRHEWRAHAGRTQPSAG